AAAAGGGGDHRGGDARLAGAGQPLDEVQVGRGQGGGDRRALLRVEVGREVVGCARGVGRRQLVQPVTGEQAGEQAAAGVGRRLGDLAGVEGAAVGGEGEQAVALAGRQQGEEVVPGRRTGRRARRVA